MLLVGFCLGVDTPVSATVAGQVHHCDDVIPPGMLVSGQPTGPDTRTHQERRLAAQVRAACRPVERRAEWAVWGALGLGGLVLLAGWTAVREREHEAELAIRRTAPAEA
jgi:hypothetical protein